MQPFPEIKSIRYRRILNSHAEFTNEYMIELCSGEAGIGSSPQGETISIYEDQAITVNPATICETIRRDRLLNIPMEQDRFDQYLETQTAIFGRNNTLALSAAFYDAVKNMPAPRIEQLQTTGKPPFPRLCLNILNGGNHAYTNPVLSDFHEYLLVSKGNDLETIIEDHKQIQDKVRERLSAASKTVVNGNIVSVFEAADNRACIEMLLESVDSLKLSGSYHLMIDASAGDLWSNGSYHFFTTDNSTRTSEELCDYWLGLIAEFGIKYLEDPFHEQDFDSWKRLTALQRGCIIIGDNLYSSDASRIRLGAANRYAHGVIVKPDQAGTISSTIRAIQEARRHNQTVITSHRSISTESLLLSTLTHKCNADAIKIGPLFSDYSSVLRLNELIRLQESV